MKSVNISGTNCATAGECMVYDALGRIVEVDSGSTKTEIWYTQLGKTAYMKGSTIQYAYGPAPGGGTALISGNLSVFTFMHKDWLGNARITSSINGHTVTVDQAFAPYGEVYDIFGSTLTKYVMFTGDTQDVIAGMYDTPDRELQGSQQGRWLSPDPAGFGWNQYAYATNPNSLVDPSGSNACIAGSNAPNVGCGNDDQDESMNSIPGGFGDPTDPMTWLDLNGCICITEEQYDAFLAPIFGGNTAVSGTVGADSGGPQNSDSGQQQNALQPSSGTSCSGAQVPCSVALVGGPLISDPIPDDEDGTVTQSYLYFFEVRDVLGTAVETPEDYPMGVQEHVVDGITGLPVDPSIHKIAQVPVPTSTGVFQDDYGITYNSNFLGYANSFTSQTFSVVLNGVEYGLSTTIWQFIDVGNYKINYAFPVIVIP
jgi:RHS repeat-associated protein